ncbi:hypothetical protein [Streptomyces odonnellii]|uniref:hypothetical protein n=1 Tax=Streptomyces odonnellii TaxID=1417980 RepID=UPI000626824C|nr:hypothetical protein [Streptomyces odonnellii]
MTPHQPLAADDPVEDWLASSLRRPRAARWHWYYEGRPALLPTGAVFDAVRMPAGLVHAAAGSGRPGAVGTALAGALDGPVIGDIAWYYALVPPRTTETWGSPLAVVRGRGAWLTVPRVDWVEPRPVGPHWAVPAERVGKLCAPDAVAELLRAGRDRYEGCAPTGPVRAEKGMP